MADNYSLDDILAEVEQTKARREASKKSEGFPKTDEAAILAEISERKSAEYAEDEEAARQRYMRSSEHELYEQKKTEAANHQFRDFSVTSILDEKTLKEMAEKRGGKKPEVETLKEKPADAPVIEKKKPEKKKKPEAESVKDKPLVSEKPDGGETSEKKGLFSSKKDKNRIREAKAEEPKETVKAVKKADEPEEKNVIPSKKEKNRITEIKPEPEIEKKKIEKPEEKPEKKSIFAVKKEKNREESAFKPDMELPDKTQVLDFNAEKRSAPPIPEPVAEPEPVDEKEIRLTTGSIELEEDIKPEAFFPTFKNEGEKAEPQHIREPLPIDREKKEEKLIDRQLKKEEELEDPDDLFDAMNPIEVRNKAAADFDDFFSGDTMGIAGNELQQLSKTNNPSDTAEVRKTAVFSGEKETDEVKTYTPEKGIVKQKHGDSELKRRSNTALLESLNKALEKKREEDLESERKLSAPTATRTTSGEFSAIAAPTHGLNIDYGKKIIQATGALPYSAAEEKIKNMEAKRKRKIRDFVLEEDEEDETEEENGDNSFEFDSYDTTGQIWNDLCESHKGLKVRFTILFILTVFLGIITILSDFGKYITFDLFGSTVSFLSRRDDPSGFIYMNMIVGVIGSIVCSSVLLNGITKLFKGKGDCDSICSVLMVVSLITTVLHLTNFDYLQRGRAFLYIVPALSGLLFNTLGKLLMIVRAKRNFRFVSGDSVKYSTAVVRDDAVASGFTKGVVNEIPCLAVMRKTEFLTDFLKNSYCEDKADRISRVLTPISFILAAVFGVISYFVPNGIEGMEQNIFWASSVAVGTLAIFAPFSIMFIVNLPLSRAGKALAKSDAVVLGYQSVEDFEGVNSVMVDASALFPAGTTVYSNIKHCRQPNSVNSIALDQAIILAASLAIKSGSVLSSMFRDMINDKDDILANVENCVYEDNMGVLGWYGNKRMIMGNREQMKHHDIKIPDMAKVKKYQKENTDTIYLAVGGEIVIMFFIELIANTEVKKFLRKLTGSGVSIIVKTTDSIITINRLAELFDISPEFIKILPYSMHEQFNVCTKYVSRGDGAISGNGTFTSFAAGLVAAKSLIKDIGIASTVMLAGVVLGGICAAAFGCFAKYSLITPSFVMLWNTAWLLLTSALSSIRRY